MFNIFRRKIKPISGVLEDIRLPEEKAKDYLSKEILAMAAPLIWEDWETWKSKPENIKMLNDVQVNNQDGVGSCASQGGSLILAINNYLEDRKFTKLSARSVYARRKNKPSVGMYMEDLGNILISYGAIPEVFCLSTNDTDENMSQLNDVISLYEAFGRITKAKNYFWLDTNIDAYAQVLAMGKPIAMTIVFGDGEFGELVPVVKPVVPKYGHLITGLENAYFTYQGKKAILIQNSWGTGYGLGGRQILTEDWFTNNRVVCAIWFEDMDNLVVFNPDMEKPHYQFNNDLYVGCAGEEVKMLQKCLGYEQDSEGYLFPLATQTATGYFGGITRSAVKRFQSKYAIEPVLGFVGEKTRAKLNSIFSE